MASNYSQFVSNFEHQPAYQYEPVSSQFTNTADVVPIVTNSSAIITDYYQSTIDNLSLPHCYNVTSLLNVNRDVPYEQGMVVFGYILPVLLLISIVTNLMIVAVLSKTQMRTSTNIVLLTMAIADLLTLLLPAPWYLYLFTLGNRKHIYRCFLKNNAAIISLYPPNKCYIFHIMFEILPALFHTYFIWLTLLLAGQRYVYVCHFSTARTWCTIPRVIRTMLTILMIAILQQMTRFFDRTFLAVKFIDNEDQVIDGCQYETSEWVDNYIGEDTYFQLYYGFRIIFVHVGPCVILVLLNLLLLRALRQTQATRERLFAVSYSQASCSSAVLASKSLDNRNNNHNPNHQNNHNNHHHHHHHHHHYYQLQQLQHQQQRRHRHNHLKRANNSMTMVDNDNNNRNTTVTTVNDEDSRNVTQLCRRKISLPTNGGNTMDDNTDNNNRPVIDDEPLKKNCEASNPIGETTLTNDPISNGSISGCSGGSATSADIRPAADVKTISTPVTNSVISGITGKWGSGLFKSNVSAAAAAAAAATTTTTTTTTSVPFTSNSCGSSKRADCNSTTIMLIVIVSEFLLLEIPLAVTTILHVIQNTFDVYLVDYQTLNIIILIANFFIILSNPINFTIYCGMSRQFRQTFAQLFVYRIMQWCDSGSKLLQRLQNRQQNHHHHQQERQKNPQNYQHKATGDQISCVNETITNASYSTYSVTNINQINQNSIVGNQTPPLQQPTPTPQPNHHCARSSSLTPILSPDNMSLQLDQTATTEDQSNQYKSTEMFGNQSIVLLVNDNRQVLETEL